MSRVTRDYLTINMPEEGKEQTKIFVARCVEGGTRLSHYQHVCVQSVRTNIREDMEDRWVTNLSEDRKRFYLVSSLLDPRTKMLSICDNKYFPSSWKDDTLGYLSMDLKSFYVKPTQGEVKDEDGQTSCKRTCKSNRCPTTQTL